MTPEFCIPFVLTYVFIYLVENRFCKCHKKIEDPVFFDV